ncbi:MAG: hypothetical protein WCL44_00085 [bacterium]
MKATHLTSHWQLFLDDSLIERATGFDQRIRQPRKHGILFPDRQPWEHGIGMFQPVYDDGRFHAIYRVNWLDPEIEAFHASQGWKGDPADLGAATEWAYATSSDGIHWERPALLLCETPVFRDGKISGRTRENNCGVPFDFIRDLGRDGNVTDPARRFLLRTRTGQGTPAGRSHHAQARNPGGLYFAAEFPDFVHDPDWQRKLMPINGRMSPRGFGNFTGWDDLNGEWIAFMQGTAPRWFPARDIARHWSKDFKTWESRGVLYPDALDPHTLEHYDEFMEIQVIRKGDLWLGFMAVFHSDRTSPDYMPPFIEKENFRFAYDLPNYCTRKGTTDLRLVTSRDGGHTWNRVANRQAWLPHGANDDDFDRCAYTGTPITVGETDHFYYMAKNGDHLESLHDRTPYYKDRTTGWNAALASYPRDRYVSISTGTYPAILYTRPMLLPPGGLRLNADASHGEIRVEIAAAPAGGIDDIHSAPVEEGFSFHDCTPVQGNGVEQPVRWRRRPDTAALQGHPVRLRFYVRNADLYGFRIEAS